MCQIFNTAVSSGRFPLEMLSANIITLPNTGKEPVSPQNFRLVSLLNNDVKLYAQLIAQEVSPYHDPIHPPQPSRLHVTQASPWCWTITDQASSLPAVSEILQRFIMCSYYKINDTKLNIVSVGVQKNTKLSLTASFPFQWQSKAMPYLGISPTTPTSNVYASNNTLF